ncbi:MAG: TerD family protein [Psychromonas sp.]|nr:TerD family protein [Alteromonadales bacterium]MCP5078667.1 TerD family protein [Psychromonas sp.]
MSISLEKGQRISLEKNGNKLDSVCVGVNWGAIEKKGFFGTKKVAVDLDASISLHGANKQSLDVVFYGQLSSKDGSIKHSGDDLTGDLDGDDGLDNEIITINLRKVPASTEKLAVILNSFQGQDFSQIPFASVRLYEGTPTRVDSVMASYNIASEDKFKGSVSMILGILYRHNDDWKFKAVGEPTKDRKLQDTIKTVSDNFLN